MLCSGVTVPNAGIGTASGQAVLGPSTAGGMVRSTAVDHWRCLFCLTLAVTGYVVVRFAQGVGMHRCCSPIPHKRKASTESLHDPMPNVGVWLNILESWQSGSLA